MPRPHLSNLRNTLTSPNLRILSNLRNTLTFPNSRILPNEHDLDLRYREQDSGGIIRHWALLGEIVNIAPWPLRLTFHVKDKVGGISLVAFYDKARGANFIDRCKVGCSMAFLYPESHLFADGQMGLRIEEEAVESGLIKAFPFPLETLLEANDKVFEEEGEPGCCIACGKKVKLMKCGRCGVGYCGKECQTADWSGGHRGLCKAIVEVRWFAGKNWATYTTPFSF